MSGAREYRRTAPLLALLRVQALMSIRGISMRLTRGRSRWTMLLLPLVALSFVPMIAMFFTITRTFYQVGAPIGQGHAVLVLAFTIGQLAALSFGVLYILSTFYFARDLRLLVPMPLRARDIVLSKFLGIVGGELLTLAPLVLPAILVYGSLAGVGPLYWPLALLIYLLLPVPALVLSSLFSFALMRFTQGRANRDLIRILGAFLAIGLGVSIQFLNRYNIGNNSRGAVEAGQRAALELLQSVPGGLAHALGRYAPTSLWAAEGLRAGADGAGVAGLAMFLGTSLLGLLLLVWFAEKLFFAGLAGIDEVRTVRHRFTAQELGEATGRSRRPLLALLLREVRLVNRNPSFLINVLIPPFLPPLLMGVAFSQDPNARAAITAITVQAGSPLVPLIGIGVAVLTGSLSSLAASAISREGRQFWISRVLPVAPRVQAAAKVLHSLTLVGIEAVLVLAVAAYLGLLSPLVAVYILVGAFLGGVASGAGGLAVDLLFPHLQWTDAAQAMKGNMNVLGGMAIAMLVVLLAGAAALLGWFLSPGVAVPAALLVLALAAAGMASWAGSLADSRYSSIEQ